MIRHFGPIQNLDFGEFDEQRSQCALGLLEVCEDAGTGARISDQIEHEIWDKVCLRRRIVHIDCSNAAANRRDEEQPSDAGVSA